MTSFAHHSNHQDVLARAMPVSTIRSSTLAELIPEYSIDAQDQIFRLLTTSCINRLVVLGDHLTETQTCHDISVLEVWDLPTLTTEFQTNSPGFFNLTNQRVLTQLQSARVSIKVPNPRLTDHFPLEPDVAQSVFGTHRYPRVSSILLLRGCVLPSKMYITSPKATTIQF